MAITVPRRRQSFPADKADCCSESRFLPLIMEKFDPKHGPSPHFGQFQCSRKGWGRAAVRPEKIRGRSIRLAVNIPGRGDGKKAEKPMKRANYTIGPSHQAGRVPEPGPNPLSPASHLLPGMSTRRLSRPMAFPGDLSKGRSFDKPFTKLGMNQSLLMNYVYQK